MCRPDPWTAVLPISPPPHRYAVRTMTGLRCRLLSDRRHLCESRDTPVAAYTNDASGCGGAWTHSLTCFGYRSYPPAFRKNWILSHSSDDADLAALSVYAMCVPSLFLLAAHVPPSHLSARARAARGDRRCASHTRLGPVTWHIISTSWYLGMWVRGAGVAARAERGSRIREDQRVQSRNKS